MGQARNGLTHGGETLRFKLLRLKLLDLSYVLNPDAHDTEIFVLNHKLDACQTYRESAAVYASHLCFGQVDRFIRGHHLLDKAFRQHALKLFLGHLSIIINTEQHSCGGVEDGDLPFLIDRNNTLHRTGYHGFHHRVGNP